MTYGDGVNKDKKRLYTIDQSDLLSDDWEAKDDMQETVIHHV